MNMKPTVGQDEWARAWVLPMAGLVEMHTVSHTTHERCLSYDQISTRLFIKYPLNHCKHDANWQQMMSRVSWNECRCMHIPTDWFKHQMLSFYHTCYPSRQTQAFRWILWHLAKIHSIAPAEWVLMMTSLGIMSLLMEQTNQHKLYLCHVMFERRYSSGRPTIYHSTCLYICRVIG